MIHHTSYAVDVQVPHPSSPVDQLALGMVLGQVPVLTHHKASDSRFNIQTLCTFVILGTTPFAPSTPRVVWLSHSCWPVRGTRSLVFIAAGYVSTLVPTPNVNLTSPHALTVVTNASTGADVLYIVSDASVVHRLNTATGACCICINFYWQY